MGFLTSSSKIQRNFTPFSQSFEGTIIGFVFIKINIVFFIKWKDKLERCFVTPCCAACALPSHGILDRQFNAHVHNPSNNVVYLKSSMRLSRYLHRTPRRLYVLVNRMHNMYRQFIVCLSHLFSSNMRLDIAQNTGEALSLFIVAIKKYYATNYSQFHRMDTL